ncbi:pAG1 protein [Xiburema virus]|uniref:PAG1 protein n=1 Tax=Xiburema virus TaxID=1272959 RepID=A0A059TXE3_9RHAB|nr:pAG1 protein [Xiburema virus]AHZ45722.1 pAG1 protein [Xiburema virus]
MERGIGFNPSQAIDGIKGALNNLGNSISSFFNDIGIKLNYWGKIFLIIIGVILGLIIIPRLISNVCTIISGLSKCLRWLWRMVSACRLRCPRLCCKFRRGDN